MTTAEQTQTLSAAGLLLDRFRRACTEAAEAADGGDLDAASEALRIGRTCLDSLRDLVEEQRR